ncbi:MAG: hypothetical protein GXP29_10180 [Planctomycetes bacterium]|nr:hypothetical protein [Planctomycetota bacterium]
MQCIDIINHQCGRAVFAVSAIASWPCIASAQGTGGNAPTDEGTVARLSLALMLLFLAVLILTMGWFLMRALQRSRKRLFRERAEPTDATDVWSMHKLPGFDSEDAGFEDGSQEGEA